MSRGEAITGFFIIVGFFATLAGFVVFFALFANDLVYRLERRRAARRPRPEPEVACAIHPIAMARSRREQRHEHTRPAA